MTQRLLQIAAAVLAFAIASSYSGLAYTAEIKVVSSSAYRGTISELARKFESATGHKVLTDFEVVAVLGRRIDAGEAFDVAVLDRAHIEAQIKDGKMFADSRATIGQFGRGLGVHKGGPKPDMGSPEAFRQALLDAKSVAYPREGGSGRLFLSLLERLDIAAKMKPKLKPAARPRQAVIDGEAEFVFAMVDEILSDPALELVGRLPPELQQYATPMIGASTASKAPEVAKAFIRFLTSPAAAPVLEAYGVETKRR